MGLYRTLASDKSKETERIGRDANNCAVKMCLDVPTLPILSQNKCFTAKTLDKMGCRGLRYSVLIDQINGDFASAVIQIKNSC